DGHDREGRRFLATAPAGRRSGAENGGDHALELADLEEWLTGHGQVEEARHELAVTGCRLRLAERGVRVWTFDLLDVEPDLGQALFHVEGVKLVGIVEALPAQHGDDVERNATRAQRRDPGHHLRVRSLARTRLPTGVVEERRAVEADSDSDLMSLDEVAVLVA